MEFYEIDALSAFDQAIETRNSDERIVVCGSGEEIEYLKEGMEINSLDVDQALSAAKKIDVAEWFQEKKIENEEELEEDEIDISEIVGIWPEQSSNKQGFTLASDVLTGKPLEKAFSVKLAASDSAEILTKFQYGGWNDCPRTEEHIAIWRYWESKYGAQIVGVSHDTVEAYVVNPPKSKEEALQLAWEQYYYCYDIVDQGCESISNLAASLLNGQVWYFWWD